MSYEEVIKTAALKEYVKEWIKKGKPFRNPEFLYKRIIERENCSLDACMVFPKPD